MGLYEAEWSMLTVSDFILALHIEIHVFGRYHVDGIEFLAKKVTQLLLT